MAVCMLILGGGYAQVTTPNNQPFGAGNFVGWDNTVTTEPLMIRHDANQPIEWYTNNLRRMFLHQTLVGQTVNGFTGVNLTGNLGIGLFNATTGSGPITRPLTLLHLDNGGSEDAGFRDWMRTGVTMSHLTDMMYVGLKRDTADISTAAIVWSDNNQGGTVGPDRLRFIFTRTPTGGTVAASDEGLEIARMIPAASGNEGYVGIGDWRSVGWNANPVERLDVLDGRVRIRALPEPAGEVTASYKVMVVDDSPAPSAERGVVKWIDPADLPPTGGGGGADCDWDISSSGNKITTAWRAVGTNGNCPEVDWNVGVGTNTPTAKLHVTREVNSGGVNHGGRFELSGTASGKRSLWGNVLGSGSQHTAVRGETVNGTIRNFGLHGLATLETDVSGIENYGGLGAAVVNEGAQSNQNAGIRGEGRVSGSAANNYGVYGYAGAFGSVANNHGVLALSTAANSSNVELNYGLNALANALSNSTVDTNYAIYGLASAGAGSVGVNYGVYGWAAGNSSVATNYGIRARSSGASSLNYGIFAQANGGGMNWAGYFVGNVHATGNVTQGSDELLKSDIEPLENAMEMITALRPKRYNYRTEEYAQLHLPTGNRMGLIAQDVQQVLPTLVLPVSHPEEYDAETGVVHSAVDYLSLNYTELVPLLIAGMQEQQAALHDQHEDNSAIRAELDELRQRLAQLEQALALCCTNPADGQQLQTPGDGSEGRMLPDAASERLLTIAPNPFTEQTTVSYTLERGGRAMLLMNGSDGKHLQVLEEGARSAGQYQYVWHTAHLASGVYYVTLLLDGEPLVKRAVKVR